MRTLHWRDQAGQGTVEWVGLVCLVALLLVGLGAAGVRVPGADLARSIAGRILCAVDLTDSCEADPALVSAYGLDLANLVRDHTPSIAYEEGMHALPVDFRSCRSTACADGPGSGIVAASDSGEPVVLFTHVIDCRHAQLAATVATGADCSGSREGRLYIQLWAYYPDSATYRGVPVAEDEGFHRDDWEGFQIRVNPDGSVDTRASSHHGYNYDPGGSDLTSLASDAGAEAITGAAEDVGLRDRGGWGRESGWYSVSGGSHAGHADGDIIDAGSATPRRRVTLIPLEPIAAAQPNTHFAITAPWRKKVWFDPEAEGTD